MESTKYWTAADSEHHAVRLIADRLDCNSGKAHAMLDELWDAGYVKTLPGGVLAIYEPPQHTWDKLWAVARLEG